MLFDDVVNTTQKLVIDSSGIDITTQAGAVTTLRDGKVGIGTSSPERVLEVEAPNPEHDGTGLRIRYNSTHYTDYRTNGVEVNPSNQQFNISQAGQERFRVHNNGNVGIGISNPQTPLTVSGDPYPLELRRAGKSGRVLFQAPYSEDDIGLAIFTGSSTPDERMRITPSGNVGIGTSTPNKGILHVEGGYSNLSNNGSNAIFSAGGFHSQGGGTTTYPGGAFGYATGNNGNNISIYGSHSIIGANYIAWSDERIKTDVQDFSGISALEIVNNIECKEYHYKDPTRVQVNKTIGFIAQDVYDQLPNAVSFKTDIIPDELRIINDKNWIEIPNENNSSGPSTYSIEIPNIDISLNNTRRFRFYVSNDPSGNDEVMKDIQIEADNKTFVFDESWNNVFLYGSEVNDLHAIDKQKIFQLHHPAIQQLSRLNDEKTQQIATMQDKIANLEARLLALESK